MTRLASEGDLSRLAPIGQRARVAELCSTHMNPGVLPDFAQVLSGRTTGRMLRSASIGLHFGPFSGANCSAWQDSENANKCADKWTDK